MSKRWFSDFIRNATYEKREEVYMSVIRAACAEQGKKMEYPTEDARVSFGRGFRADGTRPWYWILYCYNRHAYQISKSFDDFDDMLDDFNKECVPKIKNVAMRSVEAKNLIDEFSQ